MLGAMANGVQNIIAAGERRRSATQPASFVTNSDCIAWQLFWKGHRDYENQPLPGGPFRVAPCRGSVEEVDMERKCFRSLLRIHEFAKFMKVTRMDTTRILTRAWCGRGTI